MEVNTEASVPAEFRGSESSNQCIAAVLGSTTRRLSTFCCDVLSTAGADPLLLRQLYLYDSFCSVTSGAD